MEQPARTLETSVIYQIFLRAFTPAGTLDAARRLLPHIAGIGVDVVYLCPIATADDDPDPEGWSDRQRKSELHNPRNPYRIADYFSIDPEYGDAADLKRFVAAAHRLGLRVLLDLVYFHCGPRAVFLTEHPDWIEREADGRPKIGRWRFPRLDFSAPGLDGYLWRNMEYFVAEFGVDGYRCDVSGNVPLAFWEEGRRRLEAIRPDVVMVAESEHDATAAQRAAFDVNYCFSSGHVLHDVATGKLPVSAVRENWLSVRESHPAARFLRGFDNHDLANDDYDRRPDGHGRSLRADAALAVMFLLDGVPFLYNGQEIADGRRHSLFGDRAHGGNLLVDWSNALTDDGRKRLDLVRALIAERRRHDVFTNGEVVWPEHDRPDEVVAFYRRGSSGTFLVAVNFSVEPVAVAISGCDGGAGHSLILDGGAYAVRS